MEKRLLLLFILLSSAPGASAIPIDCDRILSWVERSVCVDPVLRDLDRQLAKILADLRSRMEGNSLQRLDAGQSQWERRRRDCRQANVAGQCLAQIYRSRIQRLDLQLGEASGQGAGAGTNLLPGGTLEPENWHRLLYYFLPAINACLVATPSPPASAVVVWYPGAGRVGVRTLSRQRRRYDCVAREDGRGVLLFEPVPRTQYRRGEGVAIFTPSPHQPPPGACMDHRQVSDQQGLLLGWLSLDNC